MINVSILLKNEKNEKEKNNPYGNSIQASGHKLSGSGSELLNRTSYDDENISYSLCPVW